MKIPPFFFLPILGLFVLFGCQENTPDAATTEMDAATAEMESATTEIDVATAEKMVRDFNAKFMQSPDQVVAQNTSDNFYFINGEGHFATKAQMTGMTDAFKITKWELSDLEVRAFGNVLVATGVNDHTVVSNEDGSANDYKTAFTYIYHEKNGELELVSQQHTHVVEAEAMDE